MYKHITLILTLLAVHLGAVAQTPDEIKNKETLFYDECTFHEYKNALPHLEWLLANAPTHSENIYKKGATILDKMIKAETDQNTKFELQKTAINLYQQRFDIYGPNYKIKNTQLTKAYQYWNKNKGQFEYLMGFFRENIDTYNEKISDANLLAYMDIVRRVRKYTDLINDEQVLDEYYRITSVLDMQDKASENEVINEKIHQILAQTVELDCASLDNLLGAELKDDINNVNSAKLFISLSNKSNCEESELFENAISYVLKYDPTPAIALYQAKRHLAAERLGEAESMFGTALSLTEKPQTKSDIYLNLAKIYTIREDKIQAKKYAFEAIKIDNNKKAYSLVGNLYLSSYKECLEGKDDIQQRAVFMAAYKMFEKANDTKNMEVARAQFPTTSDIFFNNYEKGQKLQISCWFTETVTLEGRN